MKSLAAIPLLALAACATTARPDDVWLVGNWCPEGGSTSYAGVPNVGFAPTRFDANGHYSTFEAHGRWDVRGDRLILLTPMGTGTFREDDRVERLGSDLMAWTRGSGQRELWRRCPPDRR